jgi:uncharacterized protein YabE (DUF348 family)
VFTLLFLTFVTFFGFIFFGGQTVDPSDKKVVNLYIDGHKQTIPTRTESVRELLTKLQIRLGNDDVVEPAVDAPITGDKFSINVYRARPVTIVDQDGEVIMARVAERKPVDIAKKIGLKIYPEDIVDVVPPDQTLATGVIGEKLVVKRALPIKLSLYGKIFSVRTQSKTVGDLAKERGIEYSNKSIYPKPETKLRADMVVFVTDPGKKIAITEQSIDPPIEYVDSTDLDIGETEVRDEGRPGKRVVVYEVAPDGSKRALQEIIVVDPQRKVVARGVKGGGFDGDFGAALARLRSCEGSYTSNTGNGYYGAYQFNISSWQANAPAAYRNTLPSNAPPGVQDLAAATYYQRSGWGPWPACSASLGLQDIYR